MQWSLSVSQVWSTLIYSITVSKVFRNLEAIKTFAGCRLVEWMTAINITFSKRLTISQLASRFGIEVLAIFFFEMQFVSC